MDSEKKARWEAAGIDVETTFSRFMQNESLLDRFMNKFLSEKSWSDLVAAVDADDMANARPAVHTFKSCCATLGFTRLNELAVSQESRMKADDWAGAKAMMPELVAEHDKICAAIAG